MRKTKLFCLALSLLMLVSLIAVPAFAATPQVTGQVSYPGPSANELYIFHTNDTHGRLTGSVESTDADAFSSAKLAGYVQTLRALGHNVLLLDAGDAVHGKVSANAFKGYSVINIMNRMGYDAMAVGNHEFDYGRERAVQLAKYAKFPVLSANFTDEKGNLVFKDMIVKEFDGFKVGIFGLTTPEATTKANPKFFVGYTFQDTVATAKKCVEALKAQGCDYIIALGHIGVDEESPVTTYDVLDAVDGIDLFIDGHSHTTFKEGKVYKNALIVSTGEYLKNVGVVKVTFGASNTATEESWLMSSADKNYSVLPEHKGTKKLLEGYTDYARQLSMQVVGHATEELVGEREFVRKQQTNLGSLITDAMRIMTDADIAITNGGGIRATIKKGDITYNDILTVLPFGNWVVVKKMTGADILTVLEESVANYPNLAGGYMHVSGISFTFDAKKPGGSRIDAKNVLVGGKPIDLNETYIVATNNFLADGGDGSSLGKGSVFGEYGPMDQMVLEYMQEYGCVYEPGERVTAIE